jgi:hypothetical protein
LPAELQWARVEEGSEINNIVLMRHGAFASILAWRCETADVNQAVFFSGFDLSRQSSGRVRRSRHRVRCPSRVLNDIVRELDPGIDERPDKPFPL